MHKIRLKPSLGFQPFLLPLFLRQNFNNMNKGTHFIGQPMYGQLLNLLDKAKILRFSREMGGERYVKHFDAWQHLVIMLYAVIKRFDSLREITDSMFPETRKLAHLGISLMPRRPTLSDANARRKECVFEAIYRKRWEIELFKQLKQNFPLRYFYGESANAIKIQIWVTLIANLLLMVMQRRITRSWSFSNLATMFRIMIMYYVNCYTFFEQPERDWLKILEMDNPPPEEQTLFD